MDTVPTEGVSVSKDVQVLDDVNGVSIIPHDKMRSLDNLVSIIDEANSKKGALWQPWQHLHDKGVYASFIVGSILCFGGSIGTALLGPVYAVGLFPIGLGFALAPLFFGKSYTYRHPTNIFNVVPRLLLRKSFRKEQKKFLELEAKLNKEKEDYRAVVEVAKSKIVALLDEVNGEMDLGTSFLSYDSENNKLELSNKHEYKSPALRQAVLSRELAERKQNGG